MFCGWGAFMVGQHQAGRTGSHPHVFKGRGRHSKRQGKVIVSALQKDGATKSWHARQSRLRASVNNGAACKRRGGSENQVERLCRYDETNNCAAAGPLGN
jgi:hypothetical protein